MSEWLKEHAWNACMRETVSEVRILSLPPIQAKKGYFASSNCTRSSNRRTSLVRMQTSSFFFLNWDMLLTFYYVYAIMEVSRS